MNESPLKPSDFPTDDFQNVSSETTILNLKCQSCGGVYNATGTNEFECPFCHAKQMLIDSDAVKIAREKIAAYRDIELGKQQAYKDIEIEKEWAKHGFKPLTDEDKKMYLKILAGLGIVLILVMFFM